MSDQDQDYAPDETPTEVFKKSENRVLDDIVLQPYSPARIWAADAMGLHYGHIDKAGMARWTKERIYPGAARDVGVVLWLCTLETEDEIDQASRDPVGAAKQALAWATEMKIHTPKIEKFWTAFALFLRIMREHHLATGELEKKNYGEPEEAEESGVIYPSPWTDYVMMVHEMSGLDETTILYHRSYARGLQYQNLWFRARKGLRMFRGDGSGGTIKAVII